MKLAIVFRYERTMTE